MPVLVGLLLSITALAAAGCGAEEKQGCDDGKSFGCVATCDEGAEAAIAAACTDGAFACPAGMVPLSDCGGAGGSGGTGGGGTGGTGGTGGGTSCPKACRLECQGESTLLDCIPDANGCPVQTPVACGEGRSCWERPNDVPRAFCADLGCGDGFLQPWEGCDDGEYNGTHMSTCFPWCQPMRKPVLVASARLEDATSTETRSFGDGAGKHIALGIPSNVGGTIAKLVLQENSTYMRVSPAPGADPIYVTSAGQAIADELTFEVHYEWPLHHVGIHPGETLWFTSELLHREVLLLRGDPAPEADAALIVDGEFDPLDPDVDLQFELWIYPGPVPCHVDAGGPRLPPWNSTQPDCVDSCDVPTDLRERTGASCIHSLWTCPAGWVEEASCG